RHAQRIDDNVRVEGELRHGGGTWPLTAATVSVADGTGRGQRVQTGEYLGLEGHKIQGGVHRLRLSAGPEELLGEGQLALVHRHVLAHPARAVSAPCHAAPRGICIRLILKLYNERSKLLDRPSAPERSRSPPV